MTDTNPALQALRAAVTGRIERGDAEPITEIPAAPTVDSFTRDYLWTALWAEHDGEGDPLDTKYGIEDFDASAIEQATADCAAFRSTFGAEIEGHEFSAAHDLWLTRNRHGAGFWDGDWPEPAATRMTDAAHALGEVYVYAGDTGGRLYMG